MAGIGYTPAREEDMRFIRHSWVESFRTSHYAGVIPMSDYFRIYHEVISSISGRDGAETLVAFNPLHPDQICGFCCYESGYTIPLLHYVYVKEDFRQLPSKDESFQHGLAAMLLEQAGIHPKEPYYYTFKTGVWARLSKWGGPFSGGIFKPLLARFDKGDAVTHEQNQAKKKPQPKEQRCA